MIPQKIAFLFEPEARLQKFVHDNLFFNTIQSSDFAAEMPLPDLA
jgi:hypothetical protein